MVVVALRDDVHFGADQVVMTIRSARVFGTDAVNAAVQLGAHLWRRTSLPFAVEIGSTVWVGLRVITLDLVPSHPGDDRNVPFSRLNR
jgi:hypothetical protein